MYIENKELYFPDILLEFYPNLVHDGHICATDPFWLEFLQVKYRDFFREFPEVAGIITAPATGESRVSIKSNRCQCERCRDVRKEEWFDNVLRAMYAPIHQAGKTLVVRDFVFDPQAHGEIAGGDGAASGRRGHFPEKYAPRLLPHVPGQQPDRECGKSPAVD